MALEFWWSVYLSTGHRSWCFKPFFLFRKYWDLSFLLFPRPIFFPLLFILPGFFPYMGYSQGYHWYDLYTFLPYISPSDKAKGRYHEHAF